MKARIDSHPLDARTFLAGAKGKPFVPAGFTNRFRAMAVQAGLPDGLSPHGLRRSTCRRLAEAGCSPHDIMAIRGRRSLAEVPRDTIEATRTGRMRRAVDRLDRIDTRTDAVKPAQAARQFPEGN
ncbi:tyrosine-type recombinase/integrase [Paracoccus spongiarum]|uniref:Tyrosine-type recombinase/integrase n=1 Tax=Paracoccus spongiarum TaxID=3064387 RepID=A0ABT9JCM4_9RHOB|nr:tyrosine-type recombinase/integrase [Paracoccus sp. 2205BS29-5]MDP5307572.1 tyrosine-type recombinase/integrase [Paracoccus sp. 2205BS29-5]